MPFPVPGETQIVTAPNLEGVSGSGAVPPRAIYDVEDLAFSLALRIVNGLAAAESGLCPVFSVIVLGTAVWVEADPRTTMMVSRHDSMPLLSTRPDIDGRAVIVIEQLALASLLAGTCTPDEIAASGHLLIEGLEPQVQAILDALEAGFARSDV